MATLAHEKVKIPYVASKCPNTANYVQKVAKIDKNDNGTSKMVESTDWKSDQYILLPSFLQLSPYGRL